MFSFSFRLRDQGGGSLIEVDQLKLFFSCGNWV
jgi:hypothetical protein